MSTTTTENLLPVEPLVIPRAEHPISRQKITPEALKVLYRLYRAGYKAYLVGGSVRDLLLKREPKDFDVATDAHPQEVKALFKNSRIIGRRFKVAHVHFGRDRIIEVATFRCTPQDVDPETLNGDAEQQRINENTFGTEQEDALRRDLTINGLFYDIGTFSVIDYVGGLRDLADGLIRTIGDPNVRIVEDPVRIIRAIRHAARTGFEIEPKTLAAIKKHHELLKTCSPARVLEEFLRELRGGYSFESFKLMLSTSALETLFPQIAQRLKQFSPDDPIPRNDWYRLQILDRLRAERGGPPHDSILIAHIMAPLFGPEIEAASDPGVSRADAAQNLEKLRGECAEICQNLAIPRRVAAAAQGHMIGLCRIRRAVAMGSLPVSMIKKSYFAEAYTLYELDAISRGETPVDPQHVEVRRSRPETRKRRRRPRRRKPD